jgi:glycosyltransferase involved in cell wall biosynthesis
MPKILILAADYQTCAWSGIAAAVKAQVEALAAAGALPAVLTRHAPSQPSTGPAVRGLDAPEYPYRGWPFDWIHLHSLALTELAWELVQRTRARIAYTAHSIVAHELAADTHSAFWSRLQFRVMRSADCVIFPSHSERNLALRFLPELAPRARVINNGLPEPSSFAEKVSRIDGPVVFAGRFTANKGIENLERILPLIRRRWPGRFVVAGGHGDADGDKAVARLRAALGDALSTPGWLSSREMRQLLGRASLVLVPSFYEPFGMIALEAMRSGSPVLAARIGGLAEIVTQDSGGRTVASYGPSDWSDAALAILNSPSLTATLSAQGPRYVADRFSARRTAERLIKEVYAA